MLVRPPPPLEPSCRLPSFSAMARTPKRTSGWVSRAIVPSLVTTRISRISSARLASTFTMRGSYACAAAAARSSSARLSTPGHVERDRLELVAARAARRREPRPGVVDAAAARDLRGGLGRALHRVPVELLDVGVAGRVALLDAHAEPHRDAARGALEDPLVEDEAAGRAVLEEEVRVVAAARRARSPRSFSARAASTAADPPGPKGAR